MSRIIIVTKNYLKMLFRAKAMLIIILVGMLMVVAALASAFHTLLDSTQAGGEFTVGYEMSENSKYVPAESGMVNAFKQQGIETVRYDGEDPEDLIRDGKVDVFVVFENDTYKIIGDKSEGINVRTVQYMLYNTDRFMAGKVGRVEIKSEPIEYTEISEAENYYGIIEIVYFLTVGSVMLTTIFLNERKNNIGMRFKSAGSSGIVLYLSKLSAGVLTSWIVQVFLATGLVVLLFDVTIGKPVISIAVLMLATVAFTAFGLFVFVAISNVAAAIGILFSALWFCGYLGGSFETYMYSPFDESIKRLSPSYYVNRTLVELSVSGHSDYLVPCVICMTAVALVFIPLGILITSKKKEV